jgi:AhpD family alkylhydroperoxidase
MAPRIVIKKLAPEAYRHLYALDGFLKQSSLDPVVWELVKIRASQLNGCAFCVDMHAFAAHEAGESLESTPRGTAPLRDIDHEIYMTHNPRHE